MEKLVRTALAAGRLAGRMPGGVKAQTEPMEREPAETLPYCSPAAAELIGQLLEEFRSACLPEALERLRQAGQILPPELLVGALSIPLAEFSGAPVVLADVLGARGRWLAARNPAWAWVRRVLDEREPPPADADAIWQQGDPLLRQSLFRRMRLTDPARARAWLATTWGWEQAALIEMLEVGLSAEDIPALTQALDENSAMWRLTPGPLRAARLLARLPGTAVAARACERADALVSYAAGTLRAKPPTAFDRAWARDGLVERRPTGGSKRAFWLMEALIYVPPAHWSQRFGLGPEELVAAAGATKYEAALVEGWSRAARLHEDMTWAPALWEWWLAPRLRSRQAEVDATYLRDLLSALVPRSLAEERIGRLFSDPADPAHANADAVVAALPAPWSAAFGTRYVAAARAAAAGDGGQQANYADWSCGLRAASKALPPACFAAALAPWTVHEPEQQVGKRWQQQIEAFIKALEMRRRVVETIPVDE